MPLSFSVIIPAYNCEAFIGEAIESAISQEGVNIEIIVVDDGSSDDTVAVAKRFGKHITIIRQPNSGPAVARNHGAKVSSGNILAFLDADDLWLPTKLKCQSRKLKDGYPMVYTDRFNIGDLGDLPEVQTDVFPMPEGKIFADLLMGNVITTSSVVIRKDIFQVLGGFRNEYIHCEDWDLWLRCSMRIPIGFCPEPLVKYRIHSGGISRNHKAMAVAHEKIISNILSMDQAKNILSIERRKVWANTWSTSAWAAAKNKDFRRALQWYGKALMAWPFNYLIWYNIARAICRRI